MSRFLISPFGVARPIGFATAAPTSADASATSARKLSLVDVTVATPIFLFSLTIFPPAAFTAARAFAAETPDS